MSPHEILLDARVLICNSREWLTSVPYPQPIHLAHTFLERAEVHLGIRALEGYSGKNSTTELLMDDPEPEEMENPYNTCEYGHHTYRLTGYDAGGMPEYRCEGCPSTDPEGDQTRDVPIARDDVNHPEYDPTDYFEPPTVGNEVI